MSRGLGDVYKRQVRKAPASDKPAGRLLDLLLVTDDGRARKVGSFRGAPPRVEGERAVLTLDSALHLLTTDASRRTVLLRFQQNANEPEEEWSSVRGSLYGIQPLTGP